MQSSSRRQNMIKKFAPRLAESVAEARTAMLMLRPRARQGQGCTAPEGVLSDQASRSAAMGRVPAPGRRGGGGGGVLGLGCICALRVDAECALLAGSRERGGLPAARRQGQGLQARPCRPFHARRGGPPPGPGGAADIVVQTTRNRTMRRRRDASSAPAGQKGPRVTQSGLGCTGARAPRSAPPCFPVAGVT